VHLPPVLVHAVHDREHRRSADQHDAGEALDPRQRPPTGPEDNGADSTKSGKVVGPIRRQQVARERRRSPILIEAADDPMLPSGVLDDAKYIDLTHTIAPDVPVWYGFGPS